MARPGGSRRIGSGAALGLALSLTFSGAAIAQPMAIANVIPEPASVEAAAGAPVPIADGTPVIAPRGDPEAQAVAAYLADLVRKTHGLQLVVSGGRAPLGRAVIRLSRRPGLADGAYVLEAGRGQVLVSASTPAGLFYGAVTLWQLMVQDRGRGAVELQPVHIEDAPRFRWRGLMLDSARHFQPPAEIERMIDWMALHKLNVLHWHLTDDQGWRLEIRGHPRLTEVGAWRTPLPGSPDAETDPATGRPRRYGGFYTQAEVRRIVAYAAARHLMIVPEIEMPGHAVSALLAEPELGVGPPPPPEDQAKWGQFPYVYNLDDRTFAAIEDILAQVIDLFPGPYVHIGGDEAVKQRWEQSPAVQARMRALGIPDAAAVQPYFTRRIAAFLAAHGRRLVGWDEVLQGGQLPGDAVVMSWHGVDGALAAARAGHDAVLAPAPVLYFDNRQGDGPDEPPGRGLVVGLKDVYAFEPLPAGTDPRAAGHILGLQGNLWTEHVRTAAELEAMAFPRAAAVAETGWSAPARRDWPGFVRRLPAEFARDADLGIAADPAALAVRIDAEPGADPGHALVTLSSQAGVGEIRYSTGGAPPTMASPLYQQPLAAALPLQVRAALFLDGAEAGVPSERRLDALSIRRRSSQELKICNDRLTLNLEGPSGAVYLTNPLDACWIYPAADLDGVSRLSVAVGRLPYMFGLDAAHNSVILHPPEGPDGELEVRQDGCQNEPIAVIPLPGPGAPKDAVLSASLPPRSGRHDLCFLFTSSRLDPMQVIRWVQLQPDAGGR